MVHGDVVGGGSGVVVGGLVVGGNVVGGLVLLFGVVVVGEIPSSHCEYPRKPIGHHAYRQQT